MLCAECSSREFETPTPTPSSQVPGKDEGRKESEGRAAAEESGPADASARARRVQ